MILVRPSSAENNAGPLFAIEKAFDPHFSKANTLNIYTDALFLLKYVKEGDWSGVQKGLSFDKEKLFHSSYSFGTTFHINFLAMVEDFKAHIIGVGSSQLIFSMNSAPNFYEIVPPLINGLMGTMDDPKALGEAPYLNFPLSIIQWVLQQTDASALAPYLLKYRKSKKPLNLYGVWDSWDNNSTTHYQVNLYGSLGLPTYTDKAKKWEPDPTLPGYNSIKSKAFPKGGVSENLTVNGVKHTVSGQFFKETCHPMLNVYFCFNNWERQYPPYKKLAKPEIVMAPTCEIHHQVKPMFKAALEGKTPVIAAPGGSCKELYK